MKTQLYCWMSLLTLAVLVVGCIPSLNPVYTTEDLIFDSSILGVWSQGQGKSRAVWEFSRLGEKAYRLAYTDEQGKYGRFVARLAEIDGTRFLDLFPESVETDSSGFYRFHLVPIHTIYLVKATEPTLQLAAIDYKWFNSFLNQNPDAIQFATFQGRKMITAPTKDVQAFVLEHKDAFTGDFKLQRVVGNVN